MNREALDIKVIKRTVLHSAASEGNMKSCRELIQSLNTTHQTINEQDHEGNTPLHLAASKGHYAVCVYLMNRGANSSAQNFQGQIPFDMRKKYSNKIFQEDLARVLIPLGTLSDDSSSESDETYLDAPSNALSKMNIGENEKIVRSLRSAQDESLVQKSRSKV